MRIALLFVFFTVLFLFNILGAGAEPVQSTNKPTAQLKAEEKARADWLEKKWKPSHELALLARGSPNGQLLNAVAAIREHQQWLAHMETNGGGLTPTLKKAITKTAAHDLKRYLPNATANELEKLISIPADKLFTIEK